MRQLSKPAFPPARHANNRAVADATEREGDMHSVAWSEVVTQDLEPGMRCS
jgi:hypothetical protein